MANTLNLGTDGNWAVKKDSLLGYNSENGNYKPLPFDFTRASSATVINKDGLIETIGSDIPRIDYSDDSKGALLLEPQRTNSITYSEDFTQWNLINTGDGQAPILTSGYTTYLGLNASRIIFNRTTTSTSDTSSIRGNDYTQSTNTFSIYIKSNTSNVNIDFRLGSSIVSYEITNEWKRMEFNGSDFYRSYFGFIGNDSDLYADLSIVAAQLEQGSYATSYIPTQGSAVTRLADACSQLLPNAVPTSGTIYAEIELFDSVLSSSSSQIRFGLGFENSTANWLFFGIESGDNLRTFIRANDVNSFDNILNGVFTTAGVYKIAMRFATNDSKVFVNGVQKSSSTGSVIASNLNNLNIGGGIGNVAILNSIKTKDFKLYNTALTDQELQALTQV